MDGPFIFIGTHRIREGKLEEFKKDTLAVVDAVKENEPQIIAFNIFFNADETEASGVQVHPNADSMITHMNLMRERIQSATEEQLETKDIQIYGPQNELVMGMIEQLTQAGVPLSVKPLHFAGFTRA